MNWDDLRFVLAIARTETLSAAARRLRVDQTTVARRLAALEHAAGQKLFLRTGGRLAATEMGGRVTTRAEQVESEMLALERELTGADKMPEGTVRVTAVPVLTNRLLIPRLGPVLRRYPGLKVEMIAEPRNFNLTKRDADIAVRLARPEAGAALCRRLGTISYSVYGPAGASVETLPWLTYEEDYEHLPQARWIARSCAGSEAIRLRLSDAESVFQAVAAGLGRSVLPDFLAGPEAGVERLSDQPILSREAWLLAHPDLRHLPRVSAVIDWLGEVFERFHQTAEGPPSAGVRSVS